MRVPPEIFGAQTGRPTIKVNLSDLVSEIRFTSRSSSSNESRPRNSGFLSTSAQLAASYSLALNQLSLCLAGDDRSTTTFAGSTSTFELTGAGDGANHRHGLLGLGVEQKLQLCTDDLHNTIAIILVQHASFILKQ